MSADLLRSAHAGGALPRDADSRGEADFRRLAEGLGDVFWLEDTNTAELLYISPGCEPIWGLTAEELRNRPARLREGIVADGGLAWNEAVDRECYIVHPAGTRCFVRLRTVLFHDELGQLVRVAGIAEDITTRWLAQRQVEADQADMRTLAMELVLAEERERRRLAVDLHDGLTQSLAAARIKLSILANRVPSSELRMVEEVTHLVDAGLTDARLLTYELSPPVLHDLGLVPALRWLADDMKTRFGLQVHVVDDGRPTPSHEQSRVLLFRSTRELLINVTKHAGVSLARVVVRSWNGGTIVRVTDLGRGYDHPAKDGLPKGGGYGLFSIRERLRHMGGCMRTHTATDHGTAVVLWVPLGLAAGGEAHE